MLGFSKVAPILGIRDRLGRGEDPVADRLAAQQPKINRCRSWQRALETGALEVLVDAIGFGIDILLGQRVAEG